MHIHHAWTKRQNKMVDCELNVLDITPAELILNGSSNTNTEWN